MDKVVLVPIEEWDALQATIAELKAIEAGKPSMSVVAAWPRFTSMRITNPDEIMEKLSLELSTAVVNLRSQEEKIRELQDLLVKKQILLEKSKRPLFGNIFK